MPLCAGVRARLARELAVLVVPARLARELAVLVMPARLARELAGLVVPARLARELAVPTCLCILCSGKLFAFLACISKTLLPTLSMRSLERSLGQELSKYICACVPVCLMCLGACSYPAPSGGPPLFENDKPVQLRHGVLLRLWALKMRPLAELYMLLVDAK